MSSLRCFCPKTSKKLRMMMTVTSPPMKVKTKKWLNLPPKRLMKKRFSPEKHLLKKMKR